MWLKRYGAGHSVIILEAQMHPGGRVHTLRDGLSDDLYAEAGAGRILRTHTVTLEWIKRFGLELEPFYPASLAQVALLKGKRVKLSMDGTVDMSLVPLDLTPEEVRIGLANLVSINSILKRKKALDPGSYEAASKPLWTALKCLSAPDVAVNVWDQILGVKSGGKILMGDSFGIAMNHDVKCQTCRSILDELMTALSEIRSSPRLRDNLRADGQHLLSMGTEEGVDDAVRRFVERFFVN